MRPDAEPGASGEDPPDEPRVQRVTATFPVGALFEKPWYSQLMRTARGFTKTHPETAIVLAQMAVEVWVELAFRELLEARDLGELEEPIRDLLPSQYNFTRKEARTLWQALTGAAITEPNTVWRRYLAHKTRRNGVVHGGRRATPADAEESVEAATEFITHHQRVLKSLFGKS